MCQEILAPHPDPPSAPPVAPDAAGDVPMAAVVGSVGDAPDADGEDIAEAVFPYYLIVAAARVLGETAHKVQSQLICQLENTVGIREALASAS